MEVSIWEHHRALIIWAPFRCSGFPRRWTSSTAMAVQKYLEVNDSHNRTPKENWIKLDKCFLFIYLYLGCWEQPRIGVTITTLIHCWSVGTGIPEAERPSGTVPSLADGGDGDDGGLSDKIIPNLHINFNHIYICVYNMIYMYIY